MRLWFLPLFTIHALWLAPYIPSFDKSGVPRDPGRRKHFRIRSAISRLTTYQAIFGDSCVNRLSRVKDRELDVLIRLIMRTKRSVETVQSLLTD